MTTFPFTAVVGQDELKLALEIAVVDRSIGGVLAFGDRGTGKSTAIRALARLLPPMRVVDGCAYHCDPATDCEMCDGSARVRNEVEVPVPVVDLPLGATEDRVVGALDLEAALTRGERRFSPGLLASAHRGFLYIDEVNLLPDHLVDLLLDVAASGQNVVEREGVSVRHPARFVLIGSGNPEEGELRPQLLDRFGLSLEVRTPADTATRVEVVKRRLEFDRDPEAFVARFADEEETLMRRLSDARARLAEVAVSDGIVERASLLCQALDTDGPARRADADSRGPRRRQSRWLPRGDRSGSGSRGPTRAAAPAAPFAPRRGRLGGSDRQGHRRRPLDVTHATDIALAAELLAVDPHRLGGMWLHGASGPVRDRVGRELEAAQDRAMLRLPAHITEDRLLGGLALGGNAQRRPRGRAARPSRRGGRRPTVGADGGAARASHRPSPVLCPRPRRGPPSSATGLSRSFPVSRFGVIALDESVGEEAPAPDELRDRLAFWFDLADADRGTFSGAQESRARRGPRPRAYGIPRSSNVSRPPETGSRRSRSTRRRSPLFANAASALGVESLRAMTLAGRVGTGARRAQGFRPGQRRRRSRRRPPRPRSSRHSHSGSGRSGCRDAARGVTFVPRVRGTSRPDRSDDEADSTPDAVPRSRSRDRVVDAAESGIPSKVFLDRLRSGRSRARSSRATGRARGAHRTSLDKGRPAGVRAARPGPGVRLNVVETLRAAAPWQKLRQGANHVQVRPEDFRVTRYRDREQACVIFVVDASGSAAMQRLGEAKGAVERVLGDCYARRDQVALIAFRRDRAELVVPPTRSLTRARRCLTGLVGGGTTPLAAGLDAARTLAEDLRRKGQTPIVVLMTDGRANVTPGRR